MPTTASMRAVSIARDGTTWVSAQRGIVLRSVDEGLTWSVDSIPAAHAFDLRGVAAIDRRTALAMVATADTARIYRTDDGARTWTTVYDDTRRGAFLDALAAWDARHLIAFGDPIAGAFLVLVSDDGGAHWQPMSTPPALPGEGAFAASNSCLVTTMPGAAWFVTGGGPVARRFRTTDYGRHWLVDTLPIPTGAASAGAFSAALAGAHGVIVGGDYARPDDSARVNVARSDDGGATWSAVHHIPYVSAVAPVGSAWIATGPRGTWMSRDDGRTWTPRDTAAYNAIGVAPHRIVLVGPDGAVASFNRTELGP